MIGKKDIELLRLKTRLAECKEVLETSPYASQQTVAKNTLQDLQEQYKEISGEYANDYLVVTERFSSHANWDVNSAKRSSDGYAFNVEDTYTNVKGEELTITRMYVSNDGRILAETSLNQDVLDLWNVTVDENGVITVKP